MLRFLGGAYARSGREMQARQILQELQERSGHGVFPYIDAAQINYDLGELDLAFEQLERAFEQRTAGVWYVAGDSAYAWPRSDPRLVRLLDRPELKWLERVNHQNHEIT